MKRYIDGFVVPIPSDQIDEYESIARVAAEVWKDCGVLEYWECVGDDLDLEYVRSFRDLANAKQNETVMFAWVVFESREVRDLANQKIMSDPRMTKLMDPDNPIFDCSRMAQGGFRELLSMSLFSRPKSPEDFLGSYDDGAIKDDGRCKNRLAKFAQRQLLCTLARDLMNKSLPLFREGIEFIANERQRR